MQDILLLTLDDGTQFHLEKDGLHTVGSGACSIQIAELEPQHASLVVARQRVMLKPDDGTVTLNGNIVTGMVPVMPGDLITLGPVTMQFQFHLPTAPAAQSARRLLPLRSSDDYFKMPELQFDDDSTLAASVPPMAAPPSLSTQTPLSIPLSAPTLSINEDDDNVISSGALEETNTDDKEDEDNKVGTLQMPQPLVPATSAAGADDVFFSIYYPREAPVQKERRVYIYAHVAQAVNDIAEDVASFLEELGGLIPRPRQAADPARIALGTPITILLECAELDFEPISQTRRWDNEWVRFDFTFTPPAHLLGQVLNVRVSVQVLNIEVAAIPNCAIEVISSDIAANVSPSITSDNPLARAKMRSQAVSLYQKIFISYSRRDSDIVTAYQRVQQMVGNDIFLDTVSIRAGENWQAALAQAIDEADIFQLFWSPHSATSDNVRDEWQYALMIRCANSSPVEFIRPAYWQQPMPEPPPQLQHLNFRYVDWGS